MEENKIIEINRQADVLIISFVQSSICGAAGVDEITNQIRTLIDADKPEKLIIDFEGVKFFSSQVLGLLVDTWRRLSEYQGQMLLSGINPQINRVFKITNLDKIFQFYPDKESAINALCQ
jgi:anti-sigma B factor antagonist